MRSKGFTLIEVIIVVLIIGLLLGIAVPQWMHSREYAQSRTCVSNLRQIDAAKEMFAQEMNLPNGTSVNLNDLWPTYIRASTKPECPSGGTYTIGVIGEAPSCSVQAGLFPHVIGF